MKNWLEAIQSLIRLDLRSIRTGHLILLRDDLYKFLLTLDKEIANRNSRGEENGNYL